MKMSQEDYQMLKEDFSVAVEYFELTKANFVKGDGVLNVSNMWTIAHRVDFERRNDDNHPIYVTGQYERMLPFLDWSHFNKFYGKGLHDVQIETALKKICRELGFS